MRSSEESAGTAHSKPPEGMWTQGREQGRRLGVPRGREGPGAPTGLSKQQPWALDSNRGAGRVLEGTQLSQPLCTVWAAELANHKVAALLPVTRGLWLITQPAITESLFFFF